MQSRDLVTRLDALEDRRRPEPPSTILILPDDGSDAGVDPRWLGDGDPSWPVHIVRDDGSCRQCDVRHFDESPTPPAASAGGTDTETPAGAGDTGEPGLASSSRDDDPTDCPVDSRPASAGGPVS
jgi:hypothetical protein